MADEREALLREVEAEHRRAPAEGLALLQAVAERSGLNLTDLQCLTILAATGPLTAGRLAELMGITTGAVTGVVNRIERAGYVRREKDPDDGRRVVVSPIPEELARARAGLFDPRERGLGALLAAYDDRDLAVALDVLRKSNALTREETARIRATSEGGEGGEFSAPLGAAEQGRLVFANGAYRLALRAASGMDDLYRARFGGPAPKVEVAGGTVTFRFPRRLGGLLDRRGQPGEVTLNAAVPWAIEVRGGAYRVEANLGGLTLTSLVLTRGVSDVDLALPEPSGAVPIVLAGSANKVGIRRPAGVRARLSVRGTVSKLTFDEQSFDVMGGQVRLQSPGYETAADRYEIEITGSANDITIR